MSLVDLNVRPVTSPRVVVSFTASVTMPTAYLGQRLEFKPRPPPTVSTIQKAVAEHFRMTVTDLLSARQARSVARPRQVGMWLCRQLTKRSLPDIGRRFGGKDHTTVLHAVRRIEELRQTDHEVRYHCASLLEKLGGVPS